MLFIITGVHPEAKPFIAHFRLKKDMAVFPFDVFARKNVALAVTGGSAVSGAAAVGFLFGAVSPKEDCWLLNTGLCEGWPEGTLVCPHTLRDAAVNRTLYPDMLYKHSFTEGVLEGDAAAVFQAAAKFVPLHRILTVKAAEKNPQLSESHKFEIIKQAESHKFEIMKQAESYKFEIMKQAADKIIPWLENIMTKNTCADTSRPLDFSAGGEKSKVSLAWHNLFNSEERKAMEAVAVNLHLTGAMRVQLEKKCAAYKAAGDSPQNVLRPFAIVDIQSKREGKTAFARLCKSLE